MNLTVLFEDSDFLVLDKPAGMVVNRAQTVQGQTVQDWMDARYPNVFGVSPPPQADGRPNEFFSRSGIVHRIDKETSGILLAAKSESSFIALQSQFKDRTVHKTYIALTHGAVVPPDGEIRVPVGRLPWNRERFGVVPGGKEAVTRYKVMGIGEDKEGEKASVLCVYPETGRTHQIRVHLKYIQYPILGDYLYAGRKTARDDRLQIMRVMLHAWRLSCTHPIHHGILEYEAPIPSDMGAVMARFGLHISGESTS